MLLRTHTALKFFALILFMLGLIAPMCIAGVRWTSINDVVQINKSAKHQNCSTPLLPGEIPQNEEEKDNHKATCFTDNNFLELRNLYFAIHGIDISSHIITQQQDGPRLALFQVYCELLI